MTSAVSLQDLRSILKFFGNSIDGYKIDLVMQELIYALNFLLNNVVVDYANPELRKISAKVSAMKRSGKDTAELEKILEESNESKEVTGVIHCGSKVVDFSGDLIYLERLKLYYASIGKLRSLIDSLVSHDFVEPKFFREPVSEIAGRSTWFLYKRAMDRLLANDQVSQLAKDAVGLIDFITQQQKDEESTKAKWDGHSFTIEEKERIDSRYLLDFEKDCTVLFSKLKSADYIPRIKSALSRVLYYHYCNKGETREHYERFDNIGMYGHNDVKVQLLFDIVNSLSFSADRQVVFSSASDSDDFVDVLYAIYQASINIGPGERLR
jgi:hypothetical protein